MTIFDITVLRQAVETSHVYHTDDGKRLDRVLHIGQRVVSRGSHGSHYAESAHLADGDTFVRLDLETCKLTDFRIAIKLEHPIVRSPL